MKPNKPSDFNMFCMIVHSASATELDIDQYIHVYNELLHLLFFNPDIDTLILIERAERNSQEFNGDLDG